MLNWKIFGLLCYVYFELFLQTWRTVVDYAGVYTVTVYVKYGLQLTTPVADKLYRYGKEHTCCRDCEIGISNMLMR